MATTVATTFADSTYSASNKPSTTTLKADVQAIETAVNTHNAGTTGEHGVAGTIVGTSDAQTLTNKVISGASNTLSVLSAAWPVGSVFTGVVATSPATLLGFGTWSAIASGKMLIGLDSGDTQFDTVEETGGAETVTLATTNLPDHVHTGTTSGQSQTHTHTIPFSNGDQDGSGSNGAVNGGSTTSGNASVDHTHTISTSATTGANATAFSIMNPYFVVYFWKRTA